MWMAKTFSFHGKFQRQKKRRNIALEKHPVDVILFNFAKYIFHNFHSIGSFIPAALEAGNLRTGHPSSVDDLSL